ncbi:DsbA family protein [Sphingobacterium sp. E70]|uniref:DsbA family protein n=1 Tax=Sphingobacterium sp. E70 TaxID=2853439 RepID=UPI00211C9FB6|nr:DsbA family protein [Sphingobacterium sp. E70]ULT26898.1 DsbA family protein [Sphingobacterium sp. E70]
MRLYPLSRDTGKNGDQVAHTALDKWYAGGSKDFNKFSEEYQLDNYLVHQHHKIRKMREWYDTMKIRVTPTIFVNGREMPDGYRVKELKISFYRVYIDHCCGCKRNKI